MTNPSRLVAVSVRLRLPSARLDGHITWASALAGLCRRECGTIGRPSLWTADGCAATWSVQPTRSRVKDLSLFLHLFTTEQQIAFARIAVHMVHVDGTINEREAVLLDELQQEMDLAELPPEPSADLVEEDLRVFDDPISRRIFLIEVASIVTADAENHPVEVATLEGWAERLGESRDTVSTYLELSERAHAVYLEAQTLVFD